MRPGVARLTAQLLLLLSMLSSVVVGAPSQDPTADTPRMRIEVTGVNLYCTVKDSADRLVTHLTAADFQVAEDGQPQQLRYFARETDRPLSLALLIDTSPSQKAVLPA